MALFMAMRIMEGKQDYTLVVTKRPDLKDDIDTYLLVQGRGDLIK